MRPRIGAGLAWSAWAVSLGGLVAAIVMGRVTDAPGFSGNVGGGIVLVGAFAAFATVGALVASRRPNNAVGWVFCAIGVLVGVGALCQVYAHYALAVARPPAALGLAAAWVASWYWYPTIGLVLIFTLLLFPTGRLPSRRWRLVAWVAAVDLATIVVLASLPEVIDGGSYRVRNPVGVDGLAPVERSPAAGVLFFVAMAMALCAMASIIVRFRRSQGVERQQLKWFTFAACVMVLLILGGELIPSLQGLGGDAFFGLAIASVPLAVGIAVLRYRLYDIDVIINRALVYAGLTAVLALVYVAGVVGVGGLLRDSSREGRNSLVVAGSTLAVAALFRPARSRIQAFIDRRFYRSRYNAVQTLEAFSARLRDEVDLDAMSADLVAIVTNTMQPRQVSLWLRSPAP